MPKRCILPDCDSYHRAKGLCAKHYMVLYGRKHDPVEYKKSLKNKRKEYNQKRSSVEARYSNLKRSAKYRGIKVQLTLVEYTRLQLTPCHYCGDPLPKYGHGMDRKDSSKPYSWDNCVPACKNCNFIKKDIWDYDEMKAAHDAVKELRLKKGEVK